MMRDAFLYLSQNQTIRDNLLRFEFSKRASRRFVAGETPDDAIRAIREANANGILATLDHLGENVANEAQSRQATADYLLILDKIAETGVNANVSVKLTQLGMDIGHDVVISNMRGILDRARSHGNFVRLDMEDSSYTERTVQIYETLRDEGYDNVGVVLQSYLYRTLGDIQRLIPRGANIRLCKGAYKEPAEVAFPKKADVDQNYVECMKLLFSSETRVNGGYAAIATHDERLIAWAKAFAGQNGLGRGGFEFQMLHGVRRDLQLMLARQGYKVRVYVPYGTEWYPYFMRRLAERPANVVFVVQNVLRETVS
jgi:proline dehydrogenase